MLLVAEDLVRELAEQLLGAGEPEVAVRAGRVPAVANPGPEAAADAAVGECGVEVEARREPVDHDLGVGGDPQPVGRRGRHQQLGATDLVLGADPRDRERVHAAVGGDEVDQVAGLGAAEAGRSLAHHDRGRAERARDARGR